MERKKARDLRRQGEIEVGLLAVAPDKVDPPRPAYIDRDSTREFIHHFTS